MKKGNNNPQLTSSAASQQPNKPITFQKDAEQDKEDQKNQIEKILYEADLLVRENDFKKANEILNNIIKVPKQYSEDVLSLARVKIVEINKLAIQHQIQVLISQANEGIKDNDDIKANRALSDLESLEPKIRNELPELLHTNFRATLGSLHYNVAEKWSGNVKAVRSHLDKSLSFGNEQAKTAIGILDTGRNPFSGGAVTRNPSGTDYLRKSMGIG